MGRDFFMKDVYVRSFFPLAFLLLSSYFPLYFINFLLSLILTFSFTSSLSLSKLMLGVGNSYGFL